MKHMGAAAGIIAAVALAGCGGGTSGGQKTDTNKTYLSIAYAAIGEDVAHSSSLDKSLISMGHKLCKAFDDGATWASVKNRVNQDMTETTPAQNDLLMAAAVGAYCPNHKDMAPKGTFDS